MYGLDYQIMQEIARIMSEGKDDSMEPATLNRLARIRQQEILDEAAQNQGGGLLSLHPLRQLLVTLGQKLVQAGRLEAQAVGDNEPCAPNEVCT